MTLRNVYIFVITISYLPFDGWTNLNHYKYSSTIALIFLHKVFHKSSLFTTTPTTHHHKRFLQLSHNPHYTSPQEVSPALPPPPLRSYRFTQPLHQWPCLISTHPPCTSLHCTTNDYTSPHLPTLPVLFLVSLHKPLEILQFGKCPRPNRIAAG